MLPRVSKLEHKALFSSFLSLMTFFFKITRFLKTLFLPVNIVERVLGSFVVIFPINVSFQIRVSVPVKNLLWSFAYSLIFFAKIFYYRCLIGCHLKEHVIKNFAVCVLKGLYIDCFSNLMFFIGFCNFNWIIYAITFPSK